jgi:uncharacterized membrane protein
MTHADEGPRKGTAESGRVEAFSDGVFAIALTLLVLDLRAPAARGGFTHSLLHQWPAYLAYLAAFLNISAIWIHHHDLFTRVRAVDVRLICANLLLLLVASLFPWPAAVISAAVRDGTRTDQIAANLLYAAIGFLVPLAWMNIYRYLARTPALLTGATDAGYLRHAIGRASVSVVVYPIAASLSFAEPVIALVAYALVPVFFIGTLLYPRPYPGAASE